MNLKNKSLVLAVVAILIFPMIPYQAESDGFEGPTGSAALTMVNPGDGDVEDHILTVIVNYTTPDSGDWSLALFAKNKSGGEITIKSGISGGLPNGVTRTVKHNFTQQEYLWFDDDTPASDEVRARLSNSADPYQTLWRNSDCEKATMIKNLTSSSEADLDQNESIYVSGNTYLQNLTTHPREIDTINLTIFPVSQPGSPVRHVSRSVNSDTFNVSWGGKDDSGDMVDITRDYRANVTAVNEGTVTGYNITDSFSLNHTFNTTAEVSSSLADKVFTSDQSSYEEGGLDIWINKTNDINNTMSVDGEITYQSQNTAVDWTENSSQTGPYLYHWDGYWDGGTLQEGGPYQIRLNVTDGSGLWSNHTINDVWIDNTPPSAFSLSEPQDGAVVTGENELNFTWSQSSDDHLYGYRFLFGDWVGGSQDEMVNVSMGPGKTYHLLNLSSYSEDVEYWWEVDAMDGAGWTKSSSTCNDLSLDREVPGRPDHVVPKNNTYTSDSTPLLNWTEPADEYGIDHYRLEVSSQPDFNTTLVDINVSSTDHVLSTPLSDGQYHWRTTAYDMAGNKNESTSSFMVDSTEPAWPSDPLKSPANGTYDEVKNYTFRWKNASDDNLDSYVFQLANDTDFSDVVEEAALSDNRTSYNHSLSSGRFYWRVGANDTAGNTNWTGWHEIVRDVDAPDGNISIEGGATYSPSSSVTLDLTVYDDLTEDTNIEMQFSENGTFDDSWMPYASQHEYTFPSTEGAHTLSVRYRDRAGHRSEVYEDGIQLDLHGPVDCSALLQSHLSDDRYVKASVSADDNISGVDGVEIDVQPDFSSPHYQNFTYDPSSLLNYTLPSAQDNYTLYTRFLDAAGHTSSASTDWVVYDNEPPTGGITILEGDRSTSTEINYSVNASDNVQDVTEYRLKVDDGGWMDWLPYTGYEDSINISAKEGERKLSVEFRTEHGEVSEVYNDTFILDLTGPTADPYVNSDYIHTREVILHLNASAGYAELTGMRLSVDADISNGTGWMDYSSLHPLVLPSEDGEHTVSVQVRSEDGKTSTVENTSVILDTTPPTGSIEFAKEVTGDRQMEVEVNATDALDEINEVQWDLNGSFEAPDNASYPVGPLNVTLEDEYGEQTVYVRFITEHGQISEVYSETVFYDDRAPTVEYTGEEGPITTRENLSSLLQWTAQDDHGIDGCDVLIRRDTSDNFTLLAEDIEASEYNHTFEDNHTVTVRIVARDVVGNSAQTDVEIEVDVNYPPSIEEVHIPESSTVGEQDYYVRGAKDPDLDPLNITWYVNGEKASTGPGFTPEFDEAGKYNLKVVISDGQHELTREKTVEVEEEAGVGGSLWVILLTIILVGAAVVGAMYYFQNRKEKKIHSLRFDEDGAGGERADKVADVYRELGDTTADHAYKKLDDPDMGKHEFEAQTELLVGSELERHEVDGGKDRYVWVGEEELDGSESGGWEDVEADASGLEEDAGSDDGDDLGDLDEQIDEALEEDDIDEY